MFYVHEEFPEHEKWESITDPREWSECMSVWLAAGCDCRKRLTDGFISSLRLGRITPLGEVAIEAAERLVVAGLWERAPNGYRFHHWEHVQETKEQVQRRRLKWRSAARSRSAKDRESKAEHVGDSTADAAVVSGTDSRSDSESESQSNRRGLIGSERLEEISEDQRARAAVPADPDTEAQRLLRIGYAKRYEQRTGLLWTIGTNLKQIRAVAAWCEATSKQQGIPIGNVTGTVLTEFFADDGAAKEQWPWGWLSSAPGKYFARNRAVQEHMATRKGVA
jgi:hypothetical protein